MTGSTRRFPGAACRWLTLLVQLFPLVAFAEFPVAGGNAQRTGYVDMAGPAVEPTVLWERPLGVAGISDTQPVIDAEGNIYATASPINARTWEGTEAPSVVLVSFTPDGTERWRYVYTWDHTNPRYQGTWSQFSGPVLSGDTVVIGHRHGILRGVDRNTGAIRWSRDLSSDLQPITSTPVADKAGFVYVHCRDIPTVQKIHAASGDIEWVHQFVDGELGHTSSPTLSLDEKTLYIGRTVNSVSYLYAINTVDGTYKWAWSPEMSRDHSFAWSIPILGPDGTLYIQDEGLAHLHAVKDLGRIHAHQWTLGRKGEDAPRLGAVNAMGYFGQYMESATAKPVTFCVDNTGKEKWRYTQTSGRTGGMLVTSNGLYFGMNGTGAFHALDPTTGTPLWCKRVGTATAGFSEGVTLGNGGMLYTGVDATPSHPDEACLVALK